MLKMTVNDELGRTTVRLEGRVAGPWVNECTRTWQSLAPSLGSKKLRIDLRDVTHVDGKGREFLAEMYRETGADFLADTPMSKYFAQQARNENHKGVREGE
jgi:ABC-type transporter Mla MlaB component